MIKTCSATNADIPSILDLQSRNLSSNLTEKERENGFVTTPFTIPQIEAILKKDGLFIAENADQILIAYAFAGTWEYFFQWEIFKVMAVRLPQLDFNGQEITLQNSFQYGPVCIDKAYRGQGLLNLLFEKMRLTWVEKYSISITFINQVNAVSERAHVDKLGWQIIDRFAFKDNHYLGLAFDMEKSVLKKV